MMLSQRNLTIGGIALGAIAFLLATAVVRVPEDQQARVTAAMEAARSAGSQVPMGARAEELYAAFNAAGNGGQDFSAIIKTL